VRRNDLSDFVRINRNGKIAMKLDEGDGIVGVRICTAEDDILLTTANGRCIRFRVDEVRVFAGRESTGVRGIRLGADPSLGADEVISMTVLRHVGVSPAEARAYLRQASALRRALNGEDAEVAEPDVSLPEDDEEAVEEFVMSPERYGELGAMEQFVLTVSENGYGKRSSAYEYRVSGRGGKGIIAMAVTKRNGKLVASFPIEDGDQIMLVSDGGQLIRCPVEGIRIAGRSTQGVIVFNTAEDERVVSVERVSEEVGEEVGNGNEDDNAPDA
jgi:DNA gyrase subunit A